MTCLKHNFITPKGTEDLLKFKYKGGDNSPLYKCFFSPVSEYIVKHFVPPWIA